ncbi:MAG: hypothetical protein ACJ74T_01630 [Pyrinomonadaceae bacterium]
MSIERDDRDDAAGEDSVGGTHGGLAIGRTTGMGAGIADGGTPGAGEASGDDDEEGTSGGDEGASSKA